jgi:mannosyltransferase
MLAMTSKRRLPMLPLLGILTLALAVRTTWIWKDRLWFDEVWSATFAVQPLADVVIATLRFDPHPPLYYLQLHYWATISHSTGWLFANSVAWSWLSVASLFYVARTLLSERTSWIASALFAVMPGGVLLAHSLRMYPMITCLSIWAWYFTHLCLLHRISARNGIGLAAILLAISYSHATGVLIFGYAGAYGLWLIGQHRVKRSQVIWWFKINLASGLIAVPVLANSLFRSTSYSTVPGVLDVLRMLTHSSAGPWVILHPWLFIPVGIIVGMAIIVAFCDPETRSTVFGFIIVPIGLGVFISFTVRPVWLDKTFFFLAPFLTLALTVFVSRLAELAQRQLGTRAGWAVLPILTCILGVGLAAISLWQFVADPKPDNFKAAAALITAEMQSGDVVYVPLNFAFWGMAWYAIGPDWGSPLAIQGGSALDCNDRWCAILHRLGPVWRQRLHLQPLTNVINYHGVEFIVGWAVPPQVLRARRVWLVNLQSFNHPEPVRLDGHLAEEWTDGRGLTVQLLTREAARSG